MRKIFALILAIVMMLALGGCDLIPSSSAVASAPIAEPSKPASSAEVSSKAQPQSSAVTSTPIAEPSKPASSAETSSKAQPQSSAVISAPAAEPSKPASSAETSSKAQPQSSAESSVAEVSQVSYPFLDGSGFWHYQIKLNGTILPLKNDALIATSDNEYNEVIYPLSEILDYFGVLYYWDKGADDFTTVINGITVSRDCNDGTYMWFSNQRDGYGNSVIPRSVNGVFYAPNYVFEHTIGATLTKVAKGQESSRGYIDITASKEFKWGSGSASVTVVRWDGSKYVGVSPEPAVVSSEETSQNAPKTCTRCGGTRIIKCTYCYGSGGTYVLGPMVYDPFTRTMKQGPMVFQRCSMCGGGGQQTCPSCGGTGIQ